MAVEDGNGLSYIDVEELEDGKCPDAVEEAIDQNRESEDSGSVDT